MPECAVLRAVRRLRIECHKGHCISLRAVYCKTTLHQPDSFLMKSGMREKKEEFN